MGATVSDLSEKRDPDPEAIHPSGSENGAEHRGAWDLSVHHAEHRKPGDDHSEYRAAEIRGRSVCRHHVHHGQCDAADHHPGAGGGTGRAAHYELQLRRGQPETGEGYLLAYGAGLSGRNPSVRRDRGAAAGVLCPAVQQQ